MSLDGKGGQPPAASSGDGNIPATPLLAGLLRQPSIYSLTFDEFQTTLGGLGKDFGSMNMDEFLKSIWTAEETQAMASAAAMGVSGDAAGTGMAGLHSQGSLTLPRTLSQKTVDEVWRDLFKEENGSGRGPAESGLHPPQRQPTIGEITLEEFLMRAGVVREDLTQSVSRPIVNSNIGTHSTSHSNSRNVSYGDFSTSNLNDDTGLALGYPPTAQSSEAVAPHLVQNSLTMGINGVRPPYMPSMQLDTLEVTGQEGPRGIMGFGDPAVNSRLMHGVADLGAGGVPVAMDSPETSDGLGKNNGDLPSLSPSPYVFNGGIRGKKSGNVVEKVVERRQRRMIKNRESAARSRARKQAYIMELEEEVAKLKEQNLELEKKQAAILEMQKNQALEMINQECVSKKRCLRRTMTSPW